MDQSEHSISAHDIYARLGTSCPAVGADARCVRTAIDAERLVLHVTHCNTGKYGKDLPSAAVIKLLPLAGTACKP